MLRAVNVGGTGKLPMSELSSMCEDAGFQSVRTYIASGNVIFDSKLGEKKVKQLLSDKLLAYAGKPVGVMVRTAADMAEVLARNPFPKAPGNRTIAIFLDSPPSARALDDISNQVNEKVALGKREIYVLYDDNMGRSKLKIPAARDGTARNMNTVAKLTELSKRAPT